MSDAITWHKACALDELEKDDVIDVELDGVCYALYWLSDGYYATAGLCSHEQVPLADGLVCKDVIECPKHNARFHIPTGKVLRRPACTDLKTFPVKTEGDDLLIGL